MNTPDTITTASDDATTEIEQKKSTFNILPPLTFFFISSFFSLLFSFL